MNLDFINIAVTWTLVGLIWVVQLVHYPSFQYIDNSEFLKFHEHHSQSISIVVLPLMLAELALAFYLGYQSNWNFISLLPLLLVALIWLSTFLLQVPIHQQLGSGKNLKLIINLVHSNWIRTVLWTAKAFWISYYFDS
ncbi:MAG: hypothetical protein ACI9XO_002757 [Paraglaciecola sp.]|jgi:hypothetical protein